MEETNWSSDFYSDIFSLDFDSLFNTIDLESLGSKESISYVNKYSKTEILAFCHWHNQLVIGLRVVQFRGNQVRNFKI